MDDDERQQSGEPTALLASPPHEQQQIEDDHPVGEPTALLASPPHQQPRFEDDHPFADPTPLSALPPHEQQQIEDDHLVGDPTALLASPPHEQHQIEDDHPVGEPTALLASPPHEQQQIEDDHPVGEPTGLLALPPQQQPLFEDDHPFGEPTPLSALPLHEQQQIEDDHLVGDPTALLASPPHQQPQFEDDHPFGDPTPLPALPPHEQQQIEDDHPVGEPTVLLASPPHQQQQFEDDHPLSDPTPLPALPPYEQQQIEDDHLVGEPTALLASPPQYQQQIEDDHPVGELTALLASSPHQQPHFEDDHPFGDPTPLLALPPHEQQQIEDDHLAGEPSALLASPPHPQQQIEDHHLVGEAAAAPTSSSVSAASSPVGGRHVRSGSFQQWRRQMQKAWKWGPATDGNVDNCNDNSPNSHKNNNNNYSNREQGYRSSRNLELLANQKRQWYQIQSKAKDHKQYKEPTPLFEHFFIVGLHSHANLEAIEDAFAKRKTWESEVAKSEILDLSNIQCQVRVPSLEPQVLFKYPPGKQVSMRESDVPTFCFPEGVKARMLERTPSMSDLNELVFGQEHLARDDLAFLFRLKVSDNDTLYGVCLHVQDIVQREPSILGAISPLTNPPCKSNRFLVSAPRCYCILTRVPFFELHYEMLNSIIAQERLDRITQFVSEMTLSESVPRGITEHEQVNENFDSSNTQSFNSWMGYAIPADSVLGLTSPSVGLPSDREPPFLFRQLEPHSPESASASENSDFSHTRELDRESRKSWGHFDDHSSVTSGSCSDSFERTNGSLENGQTSPEITTYNSLGQRMVCIESLESVYSSVRGAGSDDEEDDLSSKHELAGYEKVMEWAKLHNNEPLQIVCAYHALSLAPRGGEIVFHPLEHLQPIKYYRLGVSSLGLGSASGIDPSFPTEVNEVNAQLAAAEEALALSIWTVATICRVLSLESVLTLIAGALLEKQVIVVCPNLGVLSAIVLSLIPMIQPFEWQSLLLPVLPIKMLDFLDAPVPFILGVQHKPTEMKRKIPDLIRVNVYKDQVKSGPLPQLPRHKELASELGPIHARLSCENSIAKRHPIYKCSEVQAEAAGDFLSVMKGYLESICSNLRAHTITNVQSNNDKVSLLLKESFIDSFPSTDQPFIKLLVDTQLFSVLSDSRLSTYEHESF